MILKVVECQFAEGALHRMQPSVEARSISIGTYLAIVTFEFVSPRPSKAGCEQNIPLTLGRITVFSDSADSTPPGSGLQRFAGLI